MYKKIILLCLVGSLVLLSLGCWDRVEIERNAFILGLGIDSCDDGNNLIITYQIALLEAFKGEEGEDSKSTQQISIKSSSLSNASNKLLSHLGDVPSFAHCKLIVFGEEYSKKGIKSSLDFLFRETNLRRNTSVCVAKGDAKKIMEFQPQTAPSSAMVIDQIIAQNSKNNSQILPMQNIGFLHQNFIRDSDTSLVKVACENDNIDVSGVGIFKDNKLIGWFTGEEVTGQRFILGEIEKGMLSVQLPWKYGGKIVLDAYNIKVSTIPKIVNNQITIKVDSIIEGDIEEIENLVPTKDLEKLVMIWNKELEEKIKMNINSVFTKSIDVLGADSFEIDKKIGNYYPEFWETHKGEWDEILKTINLDLDIKVKIRRIGSIEP